MTGPDRQLAPEVRLDAVPRVAAGDAAPVRVHVRNRAGAPRRMLVSLVGLDAAWLPLPVITEPVAPGDEVVVEVAVTPAAGSAPGQYPFAVAVQPDGEAVAAATVVDAELVVGERGRVSMQVEPENPRGMRTRRIEVRLDNPGPEPVTVDLESRSTTELRVRLRHKHVSVPAAGSARVTGRVSTTHWRFGGGRRRLPFSVVAQTSAAPVRFDGLFTARPLLAPTATKVLAFVLVVALWAGVAIVGLQKVSERARGGTQTTAAAGTNGAGSGSGGAGGSGGSAGSGGSGGSGTAGGKSGSAGAKGAKAGTSTAASPTARINGTVTGADPSGVRVSIEPTSLVDEKAEGAQPVGFKNASFALGKVPATLASYSPARVPAAPVVSQRRATSTTNDGAWAFAGIRAPGYYLLTFSKAGYQTRKYVVSADALAEPKPLEVPMVAGKGALTGRVEGPSGPIGGATVTLTDGTVTVTTSTASTGAVGTFSVDGLSTPSTYLVSASHDGYGLESAMMSLAAGGQSDVTLKLKRGVGSLVGSVTGPDEGGEVVPLGNVTVTATNGDVTRTASTVTTGPVGSYTLPELPVPSTYTVTVTADGYQPQTQQVSLAAGASSATVDAVLTRSTATVEGMVSDPAGLGLVGAGLVLEGPNGTYKTMSVSDPAGSYRFNGVAPGSYVVRAEMFGRITDLAAVEASASKSVTANLTLAPVPGGTLPADSHIRGRVVDGRSGGVLTCDDKAVPCIVTVTTVDERPEGAKTFTVTTSPDVEYLLPPVTASGGEGLLPGAHRVTVSAPGFEPTTIVVQVPQSKVVDAPQIALYPAGVITGTISAKVGSLGDGTCVVVAPLNSLSAAPACKPGGITTDSRCDIAAPAKCAVVDATGRYFVRGLTHGSYDLWVVPGTDDFVMPPKVPITLEVGATRTYDATLDRLGELDVTVLQPNGVGSPVAVANATVSITTPTGAISADTTNLGVASLTKIPAGTYNVSVTAPASAGSLTGTINSVGVGLNQKVATQIVLSKDLGIVFGRVVSQVDGQDRGVAGAKLHLSGIIGYNGTTPVPGSVDVTSDSTGCFAISSSADPATGTGDCAHAITPGVLPLVVGQVDVTADATAAGYEPFSASSVQVSSASLFRIELAPPATPVAAKVTADKAPSDYSNVSFRVISSAPGSGTVSLSADASGNVTWVDPTLTGSNLARPGKYTIQASLSGYDSAPVDVDVPLRGDLPLGTTALPITFTLTKHVSLKVSATDANGPVQGAVFILSGGGKPAESLTAPTGSNSVTFQDLSSSVTDYSVRVQAAGHAFTDTAIVFGATPTTPAADTAYVDTSSGTGSATITLAKLASISGVVYGQAGGAKYGLSGVEVTATSADGDVLTAVTTSTGAYRITGTSSFQGLLVGSAWTVTASADGYTDPTPVTYTVTADAAGAAVSKTGADLTLTAAPVSFTVTVTDDKNNQAIAGATVTLTPSSSSTAPAPQTTGSDGKATFADIAPTTYSMRVDADNYATLTQTVTLQVGVATQQLPVSLVAAQNSVSGVVTGLRGGQTVALDAHISASPTTKKGTAAETDADSGGNYTLALQDGAYDITFSKAGYTDQKISVTVSKGTSLTKNVNLTAISYNVTVTVSSSSGQPMTGTSVTLLAKSGSTGQSQGPTPVTTSSTGTYVAAFNQVLPGDYTIQVSGGGHVPAEAAWTLTADPTTAAPSVTVQESVLQVTLSTSDGGAPIAVVALKTGTTADGSVNVTADGQAHSLFVPGTPDAATITAPGYQDKDATIVSGALAATLDPKPGSAAITVKDDKSNAVNKATVTLTLGSVAKSGTTGSDGAVTISGLSPGTYAVTVTGYTITSAATEITITRGQETSLSLTVTANSKSTTTPTPTPTP